MKALDYFGTSNKNNDMKYLRSKYLVSNIERIRDERNERMEKDNTPHVLLQYPQDRDILEVTSDLLIHYVS